MAVLTKLNEKDFIEILDLYGLNGFVKATHYPHALDNTVFIIDLKKVRLF